MYAKGKAEVVSSKVVTFQLLLRTLEESKLVNLCQWFDGLKEYFYFIPQPVLGMTLLAKSEENEELKMKSDLLTKSFKTSVNCSKNQLTKLCKSFTYVERLCM